MVGSWWLVVGGVTKGYTCDTPHDVYFKDNFLFHSTHFKVFMMRISR